MATFYDQYGKKINMEERMEIACAYNEERKGKFEGEITDEITFLHDGEFEVMSGMIVSAEAGESILLPVGYNLVVDAFSKLIAMLVKRDTTYASDANYKIYWEVGAGNSSWSDSAPPAPAASDTALLAAAYRKVITPSADISYIDSSNAVSASPTNRLQIITTFGSAEANGYLREFGIFAGAATATLGSGTMINRKTHGVIYKTSGMDLKRTLRFTF